MPSLAFLALGWPALPKGIQVRSLALTFQPITELSTPRNLPTGRLLFILLDAVWPLAGLCACLAHFSSMAGFPKQESDLPLSSSQLSSGSHGSLSNAPLSLQMGQHP